MKINTKAVLQNCYAVYMNYEDILNSYVSDYYVDSHWNKLPKSWQQYFNNISENEIADLLDLKQPIKTMQPLSLICLRKLIVYNMIPRTCIDLSPANHVVNDPFFIKYFWKGVKLKKRHEINAMAEICYRTAVQTDCFYIVDVGSGLGHLSRMLSYGYGLNVCTFEADPALSCLAAKLDEEFENSLHSKKIKHNNPLRTIHINKKIDSTLEVLDFFNIVKNSFQKSDANFKFGIVGLHPCGDLGSTLLRLYSECSNVTYINIASCCYMKLTLSSPQQQVVVPKFNVGFPLSKYCKKMGFCLSYLSCEIACHAIENYVKKVKESKHFCQFKIHAYRAALEKFLMSVDKTLKHCPVCSVKYNENLSFKEYCDITLKKNGIVFPNTNVTLFEELINNTWKNVVVFYSIRLLLAPLVETIILLDRLLYTQESKSSSDIVPLFDCNISPRNHVLCATKNKNL